MHDSAASLSWPYTNEYVNSYLKARAFNYISIALHMFRSSTDLDPQLLKGFAGMDFPKALLNDAYLFPEGGPLRATSWSCGSIIKRVRGTIFCQIPSDELHISDLNDLREVSTSFPCG